MQILKLIAKRTMIISGWWAECLLVLVSALARLATPELTETQLFLLLWPVLIVFGFGGVFLIWASGKINA